MFWTNQPFICMVCLITLVPQGCGAVWSFPQSCEGEWLTAQLPKLLIALQRIFGSLLLPLNAESVEPAVNRGHSFLAQEVMLQIQKVRKLNAVCEGLNLVGPILS